MNKTRVTAAMVAIIIPIVESNMLSLLLLLLLLPDSLSDNTSVLVLVEMVAEGETPKLLRSTGSVIINEMRTSVYNTVLKCNCCSIKLSPLVFGIPYFASLNCLFPIIFFYSIISFIKKSIYQILF